MQQSEASAEGAFQHALQTTGKAIVGSSRNGPPVQDIAFVLRDCIGANHCSDRVELLRVRYSVSESGRDQSWSEVREIPEVTSADIPFETFTYKAIGRQRGDKAQAGETAPSKLARYDGVYEGQVIKNGSRRTLCLWRTETLAHRVDLLETSASDGSCGVVPHDTADAPLVASPGHRLKWFALSTSAEVTPSLPDLPSEDDVSRAFSDIRGLLSQCAHDRTGTIRLKVEIVGWSGKASEVVVEEEDQTAVDCIRRAVLFARFPLFRQLRFTVSREVNLP